MGGWSWGDLCAGKKAQLLADSCGAFITHESKKKNKTRSETAAVTLASGLGKGILGSSPTLSNIINIDGEVTEGDSFQSFFAQTCAAQQLHHPSVVQEPDTRSLWGSPVPGSFSARVPQFPGKGKRAVFTPVEVAQTQVARASVWDPLSRAHCAPRPGLDGLPGEPEASVRGGDSRSALARRPTDLDLDICSDPALPAFVLVTAVRRASGANGLQRFQGPNNRKPSSALEKVYKRTPRFFSAGPSLLRPFLPQRRSKVAWPFEEGESKGFLADRTGDRRELGALWGLLSQKLGWGQSWMLLG